MDMLLKTECGAAFIWAVRAVVVLMRLAILMATSTPWYRWWHLSWVIGVARAPSGFRHGHVPLRSMRVDARQRYSTRTIRDKLGDCSFQG